MVILTKSGNTPVEKDKNTYRLNANINLLLKEKYISASSFPLLEEVYSRLLNNIPKILQDFLNYDTTVEFVSSESVKFNNVVHAVSNPCMVGVISSNHRNEASDALIIVENQLVYTLLDILFGGSEYNFQLKVKDRSFTRIEDNVIKDLCNILVVTLNDSLSNISTLRFKFQRLENSASSILIANTEEFCKLLTLKIKPHSKEPGRIKLLIPYSTINPYKNELTKVALKSKDFSEREKWMQHFENIIQNIKLNVSIEHSEKTHSLKSLTNIKVGNTVILNKLSDENWNIVVNDAKISDGKLGQINGRIAVEILDQIDASKYI